MRQIEDAGDASGFLTEASTRNGWRGGKVFSLLNHYRGLGAMKLSPTERLALEMSVHEETERRAMEGELAVLEAAWRDAEQIAADQRRRADAAEAVRVSERVIPSERSESRNRTGLVLDDEEERQTASANFAD